MIDAIAIEDAAGRHVGTVTFLGPAAEGGSLYGWIAYHPVNYVHSSTGRKIGRQEAIAAALMDAERLGAVEPRVKS